METNRFFFLVFFHRQSLILFRYAIAECGLSGSNGQLHNLNISTFASDLPWTPSRVRLPVDTTLFAFSKTAHGKELGKSALKC